MKITKAQEDIFLRIGVQAASIAYMKVELSRLNQGKSPDDAAELEYTAYVELIAPAMQEFESLIKEILPFIEQSQK